MKPWIGVCAAALLWAGLSGGPATALTFERVPDLDEMAADATLAFRGVVERVEFAQAAAGKNQFVPYTIITFDVIEPYAGCRRGERLSIMQMGGPTAQRPNVHLVIPGLTDFNVGEEMVVLSNDGEQPFFGTYFGDYGVLRVARDERDRRRVLDEKWHPVSRVSTGFATDGERRCAPQRSDPARCLLTGPAATDAALSVEELDATLHRVAGRNRSGRPAQTISDDRARFAAALGAFARQDIGELQRVLRKED
jgi:hypothetical protein